MTMLLRFFKAPLIYSHYDNRCPCYHHAKNLQVRSWRLTFLSLTHNLITRLYINGLTWVESTVWAYCKPNRSVTNATYLQRNNFKHLVTAYINNWSFLCNKDLGLISTNKLQHLKLIFYKENSDHQNFRFKRNLCNGQMSFKQNRVHHAGIVQTSDFLWERCHNYVTINSYSNQSFTTEACSCWLLNVNFYYFLNSFIQSLVNS